VAASDEIRALFEEYVFGFIRNDIAREIWLADRTELDLAAGIPVGRYAGGGNVLAALGLLAYTEFLGSFISGRKGFGWSRTNFNWGFRKLGEPYRELVDRDRLDVYDRFRNGLVHEYFTKDASRVVMRFAAGRERPAALGQLDTGELYFVVEPYLNDLMRAAERIYDNPHAKMPVDTGVAPTDAERDAAGKSGEDDGLA
jgi:hypothetical protein